MSRAIGAIAEQQVARYLLSSGLRLIESNYSCKGGELDLICEEGELIVFVEVRSRKSARYGGALESIGRTKQARILHAAAHYLAVRGLDHRGCRFDVVALESGHLTHVRGAFESTYTTSP